MKHAILLCLTLFFVLISITVTFAETRYVSDLKSITLRTGQGTTHKIIMMVRSGQPVEVIEEGEEWSKVRLQNGKEGWVMGRFLTTQKPSSIVLEGLMKKYEGLKDKYDKLRQTSDQLKEENNTISKELSETQNSLAETTKSFESLKRESADFFELKKKYTKATANLTELDKKVETFEKLKIKEMIMAGLTAVGVLLVGYIMGAISRKQRRRSSLL